jgi:phosphopantetheinyl transferase
MPKVWQDNTHKDSKTGLWKITESYEVLRTLSQFDANGIMHEQRKIHRMASRLILNDLLSEYGVSQAKILYQENGRPYLEHSSLEISLSHAVDYAAAAVSLHNPIGVDVEKIGPRVMRIQKKFMNETELENPDLDKLAWSTLVWSAKEAMFKLYGKGNLDFKENLLVTSKPQNLISGTIKTEKSSKELAIHYRIFDSYVFTLALSQ